MNLYSLNIRPLSSWSTPWHSDTLSGLLCWTMARARGEKALKRDIIDDMMNGHPPFVLSDAFPADLLPMPIALKLIDWPEEERKTVKRAHWLTKRQFMDIRKGEIPSAADLQGDPFNTRERLRNTISRHTNTTGDDSLYAVNETVMKAEVPRLTVYARVEEGFEEPLLSLFRLLSASGYGADASTGRGQFTVESGWVKEEELETPDELSNGIISLSHHQPASGDPMDGAWELTTKRGRLGPDFGLSNELVKKRPMVFMKPGACFRGRANSQYIGRAIPMEEMLSGETTGELSARGVRVVHCAFGLTIPCTWP